MKKKKRSGKGLYRDGKLLVIREGARCPDRCAICNKSDDVEQVEFTFARERLRYIELAAVQSVALAASDLVKGARYTGPVQTEISLCSWHRSRRIRLFGIGFGMTILAIAFLCIENALGMVIIPPGELGFLEISILNFIAFGVAFVGIVLTLSCIFDASKLWFKARNYYDRYVWVSGAGESFLADLPVIDPDVYKSDGFDPRQPLDEGRLTAEELIRRAGLDDEF